MINKTSTSSKKLVPKSACNANHCLLKFSSTIKRVFVHFCLFSLLFLVFLNHQKLKCKSRIDFQLGSMLQYEACLVQNKMIFSNIIYNFTQLTVSYSLCPLKNNILKPSFWFFFSVTNCFLQSTQPGRNIHKGRIVKITLLVSSESQVNSADCFLSPAV